MFMKFYTILLFSLFAIGFVLQKYYMNEFSSKLEDQIAENRSNLPALVAKDFHIYRYKNNVLSTFSAGQDFKYYNNKFFEVRGNIIFEKMKDKNIKGICQHIIGEILGEDRSDFIFDPKSKIKYTKIINYTYIYFDNGYGLFKNLFFDGLKNTVSSNDEFKIIDSSITLNGTGLLYKDSYLKIQNNVSGTYYPASDGEQNDN